MLGGTARFLMENHLAADRDLLELYMYLCCLGPEVFSYERATRLPLPEKYRGFLEQIVLKESKCEVSRKVGLLLSASLALKNKDAHRALGEIAALLLDVDVKCGYDVLKHMCASLPEHISGSCGEVLLSLAISIEKALRLGKQNCEDVSKLRYLICCLSSLKLEPKARSRLFLALVQSLETQDVFQDIILTSLYPDAAQEALGCLLSGNGKVASLLLRGAKMRPNGKSEFYSVCKAVMEVAPAKGLCLLGRMYHSLVSGDGEVRALQSFIRASVFIGIEKLIAERRDFQEVFGKDLPLPALALLTVVLPGMQEPHKSAMCEFVLSSVFDRLKSQELVVDDVQMYATTIIGATVNHCDPNKAGGMVRKGFMDANGQIHVRLESSTEFGAPRTQYGVFLRILQEVTREFRRRNSTAKTLEPIVEILMNNAVEVMTDKEVLVA